MAWTGTCALLPQQKHQEHCSGCVCVCVCQMHHFVRFVCLTKRHGDKTKTQMHGRRTNVPDHSVRDAAGTECATAAKGTHVPSVRPWRRAAETSRQHPHPAGNLSHNNATSRDRSRCPSPQSSITSRSTRAENLCGCTGTIVGCEIQRSPDNALNQSANALLWAVISHQKTSGHCFVHCVTWYHRKSQPQS